MCYIARRRSGAGHFCVARDLLLGCGGGRGGLGSLEGLGGRGGLGSLGGHKRRMGLDIIHCVDFFAGLLGLLAHTDVFEAILRYISLCAYIGKDPPI